MTVRRLVNLFSAFEYVPIEVDEVRKQIVEWGYHDRIVIRPFDGSVRYLRGMLLQYRMVAPYGGESSHCVIRYNSAMPVEWQRLTCVKELIHSMDSVQLRTNSKEKAADLLDKLSLNGEINDGMPLAAIFEEVATYQALAILCPDTAIQSFNRTNATIEDVARILDVPEPYAGLVMQPNWLELRERVILFAE